MSQEAACGRKPNKRIGIRYPVRTNARPVNSSTYYEYFCNLLKPMKSTLGRIDHDLSKYEIYGGIFRETKVLDKIQNSFLPLTKPIKIRWLINTGVLH
jgi:hypothetical protein